MVLLEKGDALAVIRNNEQGIVARHERKQLMREARRRKRAVRPSRKKAVGSRNSRDASTKRRRDGGKAACRTKVQKKPKYGGVEDLADLSLPVEWFPTSRSSMRTALNEPVPIQRLLLAYPEMDVSIVDTLPKDFKERFPGPLQLPPHYNTENNVTTHNVGQGVVPFMDFVGKHPELPFNPKTFAAATIHTEECTSLTFRSRSMVTAGPKCLSSACLGAAMLVLLLTKWKVRCSFHNFQSQNLVASARVGFPIDLEKLCTWVNSDHKYGSARYEKLFPGLTFRFTHVRIVILVFLAGNLVITGGRTPAQVAYILTWFYYTVLVHFRDDSLNISSSEYRTNQSLIRLNTMFHQLQQKASGTKGKGAKKATAEEAAKINEELMRKRANAFVQDVDKVIQDSLLQDIVDPVVKPLPNMQGFADSIQERKKILLMQAQSSIKEYGNDFNIRAFAENPICVLWWDIRQRDRTSEEDPRWYTSVFTKGIHNNLFEGQDEAPLVYENQFLCLQTLRIRHLVLTGHDRFDPEVLNMQLDCVDELVMDYGGNPGFEIKRHPDLFPFQKEPMAAPSAKWEKPSQEDAEKLLYLYKLLSLENSPTPPGTWDQIMPGEPRLPVYKQHVINQHDHSHLRERLDMIKARLRVALEQEKSVNHVENVSN